MELVIAYGFSEGRGGVEWRGAQLTVLGVWVVSSDFSGAADSS
jgi:hypothetical protein